MLILFPAVGVEPITIKDEEDVTETEVDNTKESPDNSKEENSEESPEDVHEIINGEMKIQKLKEILER